MSDPKQSKRGRPRNSALENYSKNQKFSLREDWGDGATIEDFSEREWTEEDRELLVKAQKLCEMMNDGATVDVKECRALLNWSTEALERLLYHDATALSSSALAVVLATLGRDLIQDPVFTVKRFMFACRRRDYPSLNEFIEWSVVVGRELAKPIHDEKLRASFRRYSAKNEEWLPYLIKRSRQRGSWARPKTMLQIMEQTGYELKQNPGFTMQRVLYASMNFPSYAVFIEWSNLIGEKMVANPGTKENLQQRFMRYAKANPEWIELLAPTSKKARGEHE